MNLRCAVLSFFISAFVLCEEPQFAFAAQSQLIDVSQGGAFVGTISPYTGSLVSAANYNYIQPSGFPLSGPASAAFQGRLFFYAGSDGLSFNVLFNTGALGEGAVNWTISVAGSTSDPIVQLSDDPHPPADHQELVESSSNFFTGDWSYVGNTDGGVIGPISGSAWTITVNQLGYSSDKDKGITSLHAFDNSGRALPLNLNSGNSGQIVFRPEAVPEPPAATQLTLAAIAALISGRRPTSRNRV
jgi:hypothetical protein